MSKNVCNMDCFRCIFKDCINNSTRRTDWEKNAIMIAFPDGKGRNQNRKIIEKKGDFKNEK